MNIPIIQIIKVILNNCIYFLINYVIWKYKESLKVKHL
nr:MAG TPA: hypothetical protein [Caudoviricetes sp.]